MSEEQEVLAELEKNLPLNLREEVTREAILAHLELVISRLLQQNASDFFQLMYRLDIPEDKLNAALVSGDDTISGLALLLYHRQLQRIRSRREYPPFRNDANGDLAW